MPTNHDAKLAVPISSAANQTQMRNVLVKRMPYVLGASDNVQDLVSVDPDTGVTIIDILLNGRVYHFDSTDTTTAHDGVSVLVTLSGGRYKLAAGSEVVAYSVKDNTISTPPGSPVLGD